MIGMPWGLKVRKKRKIEAKQKSENNYECRE
jgi:hypothetical protein